MAIRFYASFTSGLPCSSIGIRSHDIYSDRNFFITYKDFTVFFYILPLLTDEYITELTSVKKNKEVTK